MVDLPTVRGAGGAGGGARATLVVRPAMLLVATLLVAPSVHAPPAHAAGGLATRRLGTGLPPSRSGGRLPEAWVAPVAEAPRIDGRLDDPVWSAAQTLVLGKLEARGDAGPRSSARLVRTDALLCIAFDLEEPAAASIERSAAEPDGDAWKDDSVEVFLSPDPGRGYFQVVVGAGGAVFDRRDHDDPGGWDSGARAAVALGADRWWVEISLPLASLGVADPVPVRWRGNLYRNRRAGTEGSSQAWSPTFRGDYDVPDRFGWLLFTPESPWAREEATARAQRGISVERLAGGQAVLRFDLASIPAGSRVHRARLLAGREPIDGSDPRVLEPVEIVPLAAPYAAGEAPRGAGGPLELLPPGHRSFDATGVVRGWVSGTLASCGLLVRSFPGWIPETTFLDLLFEGDVSETGAEPLPRQASGLRVFHRSGQTFIAWREIEDPVGRDEIRWGALKEILEDLDRERQVRYRIYRSPKPIDASTLPEAREVAEVRPLSAWNVTGRNKERPIDEFIATAEVLRWHQWNPFRDAAVDGDYGLDCPVDRFAIAEGEGPLPRGTGLHVHTADRDGRAYYAVTTCVDGIENVADFGPGNSLAAPLEERVAEPEPVLQRELPRMPFFSYDDRRLHFVHFAGPPWPAGPAEPFNWTVAVPIEGDEVGPGGRPLELNLHRDGYSYWRTHYRIEPGSIVLCPHDFPLETWWYGHHEALGTLRSWRWGVVRGATEKRLLWFVDWAARTWRADRGRILVTGCNGGASGSGALHLGLRHPEVFNLVVAGHGRPRPDGSLEKLQGLWGQPDWGLPTESGRSAWEELDLVRAVREAPAGVELPFVSLTYSGGDEACDALVEALLASRRAVVTHTAWGGERYLPVSARATFRSVRLDLRKDRPILAVAAVWKDADAVRNGSLLWRSEDIVDGPDRLEVTVQAAGHFEGSITPRRLQRFRVESGRTYAWRLERLGAGRGDGEGDGDRQRGGALEGHAVAADGAVLTLRDLRIPAGEWRLEVRHDRGGSR